MNRLQAIALIGTLGASVASAVGSLQATATIVKVMQEGAIPTFTATANAIGTTFTFGFMGGFLLAIAMVMFMKWTR